MNAPIVNEIRKYRDEHSRQFDYNLDAIVADYQAIPHPLLKFVS